MTNISINGSMLFSAFGVLYKQVGDVSILYFIGIPVFKRVGDVSVIFGADFLQGV